MNQLISQEYTYKDPVINSSHDWCFNLIKSLVLRAIRLNIMCIPIREDLGLGLQTPQICINIQTVRYQLFKFGELT